MRAKIPTDQSVCQERTAETVSLSRDAWSTSSRQMSQTREPLGPVYAIWGEDRGKVERALHRLQQRVQTEGGMPPEVSDAAQTPAAEIVAACETLSFGGTRLVVVRGADAWRADDATPLVDYLVAPNPATCLALISDGAVTPKLKAAVEAAGQVLDVRAGPQGQAHRAHQVVRRPHRRGVSSSRGKASGGRRSRDRATGR